MSTLAQRDTLFIGDWESLGMVHLELPQEELQPTIPFELDLYHGRAFVSLVFFTLRNMRLARGPHVLDLLFRPFREQRFLNVRTYVRCEGEPGIHFITEWISSRVCAHLGPPLYSLPYRFGQHHRTLAANGFSASVQDGATGTELSCELHFKSPFGKCAVGGIDEFLFERYAAFNGHGRRSKSFRVWHLPWEQCSCEPKILEDSLLRAHFPWFSKARITGANYSPGVREVLMGRPQRISVLGTPLARGASVQSLR